MKNEKIDVVNVKIKLFQFYENENAKSIDEKHIERYDFVTKLYQHKKFRMLRIDEYFNDEIMFRANLNDLNDFIFEMNKTLKNDLSFSMYKNDETDIYKLNIDIENEFCDIEYKIHDNDSIETLNECLMFFDVKHEINKIDNDNSNCTFTSTKRNLTNFIKYNFANIELIDEITKNV